MLKERCISYELPCSVKTVLLELRKAGYEAYVVGGAVRDILLSISPSDYDVTTSAVPEEVIKVFGEKNCHATGIAHGTVTVVVGHEPIEVTTFRVDGEYKDGRHPDQVRFSRSLEEDVLRRDFTFNALALDENGVVRDYCDGISDLEKGLVRAIGDPKKRFEEDALRILRAIRFAAQHSFTIEEDTAKEIHLLKESLKLLSAERIWQEFQKFMLGDADAVRDLLFEYADVFAVIVPEIEPMFGFEQKNPHHIYDVWTHTIVSVQHTSPDLILRMTMLLHDIGKPHSFTMDENGVGHFKGHQKISAEMSDAILKRLKVDTSTREKIILLVKNHDNPLLPSKKIARRRLAQYGEEMLRKLLAVKRADMSAHSKESAYRFEELSQFEVLLDQVLEEKLCYSYAMLDIDGHELIQAGIPQGVIIGDIKKRLLDEVIEEVLPNERKALVQRALEMYRGM